MPVAKHQACFTTKLQGQNLATFSHSAVMPIAYLQHTKNICKNCSYHCVYDCAQLCYTIQHRTIPIICPLIPQAITIAQMLFNGGEGLCFGSIKAYKVSAKTRPGLSAYAVLSSVT